MPETHLQRRLGTALVIAAAMAVWLAFQELRTERALIGGRLVMGAVVADIITDNWTRARPGAGVAADQPNRKARGYFRRGLFDFLR
jgi:hypothetical protein